MSAINSTYHFHVLIRFEIEKALMEGKIEVVDKQVLAVESQTQISNRSILAEKDRGTVAFVALLR